MHSRSSSSSSSSSILQSYMRGACSQPFTYGCIPAKQCSCTVVYQHYICNRMRRKSTCDELHITFLAASCAVCMQNYGANASAKHLCDSKAHCCCCCRLLFDADHRLLFYHRAIATSALVNYCFHIE
eukprot:14597-Heterococcus_DN1.PRE.3